MNIIKLTEAEKEALITEIQNGNEVELVEALIENRIKQVYDNFTLDGERTLSELMKQTLGEAANDLRTNAAQAWGMDRSWLTTGTKVANLAAEWLELRIEEI